MACCHSCHNPVDDGGRIGRADTCPHCGADLHCCLNCCFYDAGAYNQCREPQAERVVDKESANFCDCFAPENRPAAPSAGAAAKHNPLDGLFKK